MLYDEAAVRANVRNREGKRVFYLRQEDTLTPSARDWLSRERIAILPATEARPQRYRLLGGGYTEEKPEHMTHLNAEFLVDKTHPRILFRGKMDSLEAELILCQLNCPKWTRQLQELLELARKILRCDVLEEPLPEVKLDGLTADELRKRSHFPQDYYGVTHFMPAAADGAAVAWLNRCRCAVREAELAAAAAFRDENSLPTRQDLLQGLNRMSSMVYILMLREKVST